MLEYKNVSFRYDRKFEIHDFSLQIEKGEKVAIVGPNGGGKSTLILLAANLLHPQRGEICFNGNVYRHNSALHRCQMGIVLTKQYLLENLSVTDYWRFVGEVLGVNNEDLKNRVDFLLDLLNLQGQRNTTIKKVSQGMKTKVAVGAAFIHNPPMLLLDEPFSNLDRSTSMRIANFLKEQSPNKTLLIASHNLEYLVQCGVDRFILIENGTIVNDLLVQDEDTIDSINEFVDSYQTGLKSPGWWG